VTASPSRSVRIRTPDGEIHAGDYLSEDLICVGGATFRSSGVTFLPCAGPTKVVGVGLNYPDHPAEIGMTVPAEPVIFLKPPAH
jgi:2-keto-4-pentenoate hydratase/2-oxohepta-3-ene-1,7-dioic acid hydratase in catechol pathway